MPANRLMLLIGAVIAAAAVTVLVLLALPPSVQPWLIPILVVGALALRAFGRRG